MVYKDEVKENVEFKTTDSRFKDGKLGLIGFVLGLNWL